MTAMELTERQLANFWAKIDKTETCWNWTAGTSHGYGVFHVGRKARPAHRVSYQIHVGAIQEGRQLDHICHNRPCVNPAHLRPVTAKQNCENAGGAQRNSKSGVRGVTWDNSRLKWRASICHDWKQMNLGCYKTIEEAERVVVAKRLELFTHSDMDKRAS